MTSEALSTHDWLALGLLPSPRQWTFISQEGIQRTVRMRSRLSTDTITLLKRLVCDGGGITVLDTLSAASALASVQRIHLLPLWQLATGGTYAVNPPGHLISTKARTLVAYYRAHCTDVSRRDMLP